ncbi:MAG: hypothetical protein AMXMBFR64_14510 [Myxococcales bacterium]
MKFPSGASAPGHRIVATGAGQRARIVVGLIISKAPTDHGQLRAAITDARERLTKAGLPEESPLRAAADAGFLGDDDQVYIQEARETVDIVVPPPTEGTRKTGDVEMFKRDDYNRGDDGAVICPAGTPMKPPKDLDMPIQTSTGQGCLQLPPQAEVHDRQGATVGGRHRQGAAPRRHPQAFRGAGGRGLLQDAHVLQPLSAFPSAALRWPPQSASDGGPVASNNLACSKQRRRSSGVRRSHEVRGRVPRRRWRSPRRTSAACQPTLRQ